MHFRSRVSLLLVLLFLLTACTAPTSGPTTSGKPTPSPTASASLSPESCPGRLSQDKNCYTPRDLRLAYDIETLTKLGFTGKGQTVVDIVSYGSPTLQQDIDTFSQQFGLPPVKIQVISPMGTVPFDPQNKDMTGWAGETELD